MKSTRPSMEPPDEETETDPVVRKGPSTLVFGPPRKPASQPRDPEPIRRGMVLDGKYRIEGVLGQGGMGTVYRALHKSLASPVAVKFLKATLLESDSVRRRFVREIEVLARLRHPGVVTVLDAGEHDGTPWIAMELLQGESWAQMIQPHPMSVPDALAGMQTVFEVLAFVHREGVVHRDLKPGNVMRTLSGQVKVLDFGLVYQEVPEDQRLTSPSVVIGTPAYMAPEQCLGRLPVAASDIYSTGIMLYELLTGRLPFIADGPGDMMSRHLYEMVPRLPKAIGEAAESIDAFIATVTQKAPTMRPTAEECLVLLEDIRIGFDPVAMSRKASLERARVGGLGRDERALIPDRTKILTPKPPSMTEDVVALYGMTRDRARVLRGALVTGGIRVVEPDRMEGVKVRFVLVEAEDDAGMAAEAAAQFVPGAGVIVLGTKDPAALALAVRHGAKDALMVGASDAEVVARLRTLLRRKR